MQDLYKILGVAEQVSDADLKKAYRDLARRFHPDRHAGDKAKESRFKEVSAAYQVLSDPRARAEYDARRRGGSGAAPFGAGAGATSATLDDLLRDLFSSAGGGRGPFAGNPFGGSPFGGSPFPPGPFPGGGSAGARRRPSVRRRPEREAGAGNVPGGMQSEPTPTTEPAHDGTPLERHGDDLFLDVGLTVEEAILGARVEIPTLAGKVALTIPPGTSSGKKLRLRGKGIDGRGNLYVTTQIVVPTEVDPRCHELLREFSRLAPVRPRRFGKPPDGREP